MYIKQDFSYIKTIEHKLMDQGYGRMTVHSLHFDRYYSEEQQRKNRELAETMTASEWNERCEKIAESFDKPLRAILTAFCEKYDIHQVSVETSTMAHYRSDWDLYFWSNRGWNGKDYMDCFTLSFNGNRSAEQNMKLLDEIITMMKTMEFENIGCRIQYDATIDYKKVEEDAKAICENLLGKFVTYCNMVGKIKIVNETNGNKEYGFFKKNARNRYYPVSYVEILGMSI